MERRAAARRQRREQLRRIEAKLLRRAVANSDLLLARAAIEERQIDAMGLVERGHALDFALDRERGAARDAAQIGHGEDQQHGVERGNVNAL